MSPKWGRQPHSNDKDRRAEARREQQQADGKTRNYDKVTLALSCYMMSATVLVFSPTSHTTPWKLRSRSNLTSAAIPAAGGQAARRPPSPQQCHMEYAPRSVRSDSAVPVSTIAAVRQ